MTSDFVSGVSLRQFRTGSFFRHYQQVFLSLHGRHLRGLVVEIGAEAQYGHERLFPGADRYVATNISGRADVLLDATAAPLGTGTVDVVVCVSVVEHIRQIELAFAEMARVLRPGGTLILTVPFCFPVHDRQDYWRVTDQTLMDLLADAFEPVDITRLGGKISTVAQLLQRPVGRWDRRHLPMKVLGMVFSLLLGRFDQPDDSPLGFGVVARRRGA